MNAPLSDPASPNPLCSRPKPFNRISICLPASYPYLNVLGASVEAILDTAIDAGLPDKDLLIYQARLAAHETCTNIIDHAYQGQAGFIHAHLAIETPTAPSERSLYLTQFRMDFYDTGRPFNPDRITAPNLEQAQTGGYGLFLIHSLMDQVIYEPQASQNHWQLVKMLPEKSESSSPGHHEQPAEFSNGNLKGITNGNNPHC